MRRGARAAPEKGVLGMGALEEEEAGAVLELVPFAALFGAGLSPVEAADEAAVILDLRT